jgi:peptidoglycan-associated lipoprotein
MLVDLQKFLNSPRTIALAAAFVLAGCASSVPLETQAPVDTAGAGAAQAGSSTGAKPIAPTVSQEILAAKATLNQVKPSVYFDYDSFAVKPEFQAAVSAFANYLKVDSKAQLMIEGNADERGTTEYNLALGQKRAEAVKRALSVLGVSESRIEAISNGEEKPRATGSTEAAWAENRRADMVLK